MCKAHLGCIICSYLRVWGHAPRKIFKKLGVMRLNLEAILIATYITSNSNEILNQLMELSIIIVC